jgi:hypothetical protein
MDIAELVVHQYDPTENILYVHHPHGLVLDNQAIIDEVCTYTWRSLESIGRPCYTLVDDSGVQFDLRFLDYFSHAFARCRPLILATVRYGRIHPWTRAMISLRAQEEQANTNVYTSREQALAALRKIIAAHKTHHSP